MKIWLAANVPPTPPGGVVRVMVEWQRRLSARGHQTEIVLGRSHRRPFQTLLFPLILALRMIMAGAQRPNWIIARSFDGVVCALLARVLRHYVRTALHNHGWEEHVYEVERRLPPYTLKGIHTTWKARWIRFPLLRLNLALCDYCLCGALAEMRWLSRRYPQWRRKLTCVPNGVSVEEISTDWRSATVYPPYFLFVGPETWKKNPAYACAVFDAINRRLPEARLFWIGYGSAESPAAMALIRQSNVATTVAWEEPQNMSRWYEMCPYFISSSRFEGGRSLAILEAMAHGAVVFVTPISSSMEIVRHGVNGFLLYGTDPTADASLIMTVVSDHVGQRSLRCQAIATARRHRWERQIERLERTLCR